MQWRTFLFTILCCKMHCLLIISTEMPIGLNKLNSLLLDKWLILVVCMYMMKQFFKQVLWTVAIHVTYRNEQIRRGVCKLPVITAEWNPWKCVDQSHTNRMDLICKYLSSVKSADGTFSFSRLAKVGKLVLLLPHSNAAEERVFSMHHYYK